MSSPLEIGEFLSGFLAEADDHLRSASKNLLALDQSLAKGEPHPRAVRELFRSMHTIKGLSAMIGAEPIVDIAHAMETLLRSADRAPNLLKRPAVDPLLRGLRAVEERVAALSQKKPLLEAPHALIEALEAAWSAEHAPGPTAAPTLATLPADLEQKLGAADKQQLAQGVKAGRRAVRIDFVPSAEKAAAGVTITTVRERTSRSAEIVKVVPVTRAASAEAPAGLAFALVVLTDLSLEALADAIAIEPTSLTALSEAPAAAPEPLPDEPEPEPLELTPEARDKRVVRVEVGRLDDALERLSALVVTRFKLDRAIAALKNTGADVRQLQQIAAENGRQLRDLRSAIMRARTVPVTELLERVPLIVRGLSRTTGKSVRVEIEAGNAELDKAVADRIFPAIVHLVRNAVDHAIETPEERATKGKPAEGLLKVSCSARSNTQLELTIADDGSGIDPEKVAAKAQRPVPQTDSELLDLITLPGLSTMEKATTTSGRGFGMDIVKRIAVTELGGELSMTTRRGKGTTFTLRIPLTITIIDAFSFLAGGQPFVVPVAMIEEILEVDAKRLVTSPSRTGQRQVRLLQRRGEAVPMVNLDQLFDLGKPAQDSFKALVVRKNGAPFAFQVDRMLGQQEVVVRPLEDPLVHVSGISGATDLGDGLPTLVIDLIALAGHADVPEAKA